MAASEQTTSLARIEPEGHELARQQWTVPDMMTAAQGIAGSLLLKRKAGGTSQEVVATTALLLMTARDLGLPPMASLPQMHVIEGSVSLSPHLYLALIQRARGPQDRVQIDETDGRCAVTMTRPGGLVPEYTSVWDRARAQKAKLTAKTNWQCHEAAMLRARAIGEAARVVWADVIHGLYCEGEVLEGEWTATEAPSAPAQATPASEAVEEPDEAAVALKARVRQALADFDQERREKLNARLQGYGKPIVKLAPDEQEDLELLLEVLGDNGVADTFPGADEEPDLLAEENAEVGA